eukprot:GHVS01054817.1.p1 GENE.GHVS01054817.1~~GHVS01054817.1.p1  ORF type:complete len:355 (+),score=68.94 GHVS01054817.1:238-1302(+)
MLMTTNMSLCPPRRPERSNVEAHEYYQNKQAQRYATDSNRVVQTELTQTAIQLIGQTNQRPPPERSKQERASFVMDLGCGTGMSLDALKEVYEVVVGCDSSTAMLALPPASHHAHLVQLDFSQGLPFRSNSLEAVVSISAIQWLLVDSLGRSALEKLSTFFAHLRRCLCARSGRAVLQVYLESCLSEAQMLQTEATRAGLCAMLVVDYPHKATAAKKWFLCIASSSPAAIISPSTSPLPAPRCVLAQLFNTTCSLFWRKCFNCDGGVGGEGNLVRQHIKHAHWLIRYLRRRQSCTNKTMLCTTTVSMNISAMEVAVGEALLNLFNGVSAQSLLQQLYVQSEVVINVMHSEGIQN